jgi:hypothetical protein
LSSQKEKAVSCWWCWWFQVEYDAEVIDQEDRGADVYSNGLYW